MSEWNFVIAAYGLTWVTLAGYAVHVARRLRAAAEEAARLDASKPMENER